MDYIELCFSVSVLLFSNFNILSVKFSPRKHLFILFGIGLITYVVYLFSQPLSSVMIAILFGIVLYREGYHIVISFVCSVFNMVLAALLLNMIIITFIAGSKGVNNYDYFTNNTQYMLKIMVLLLVAMYGITKLLGIIVRKFNKRFQFKDLKADNKFSLILIMSTFIIFATVYYIAYKNNTEWIDVTIIAVYLILFIAIIYTVITVYNKQAEMKLKENELNNLTEYTNKLEIIYNDMRRVKHDYSNVLTSMIGYMEEKEMDGLIKYFNEEIIPFSKQLEANNNKLGLLSMLKQVEIKAIVSNKVIMALDKGINVLIDITEPFGIESVGIVDICRITGILLDNAIEAAQGAEQPEVQIGFINGSTSKTIVINNTCKVDNEPIYKMYEEGYSTKGNNRGLGLSIYTKIVDRYAVLSKSTVIEDGYFKQVLTIKEL